jgi:lipid-A-disaccharide synthase-like uncharacterized protein
LVRCAIPAAFLYFLFFVALKKISGNVWIDKASPTDYLLMNMCSTIAVTWVGQEHRFLGLDWNYLVILGLIGNAAFSMRFLVQWFASERRGESVIPISFWYWSIGGSVIMFLYFVFRRDPVGVLAYLPNSIIYIRNLMLIRKHKLAPTAAAPSQTPREMD